MDRRSTPPRRRAQLGRQLGLQVASGQAGVRRAGDTDSTVRYLHRLLAKDPYDEQAHRDLIDTLDTAGRHGEARRARSRHTAAMGTVA